jgi:hypothetical protein
MHEGKMIPRATRDSHTQDDKIHTARQKAEAIPRTHPQFGTGSTAKQEHTFQFNETEREAQSERIRLIEEEVKWLAELPVTSPTIPLVFKHNPRSNGKYQFPSDADIVRPNHGLHALKTSPRVNAAFLRTEHRYCELLTIIQAEPNLGSDDAEDATYLIRGELERMCHEKAIQWAQQRVGITSGPALVNTGMSIYVSQRDSANITTFQKYTSTREAPATSSRKLPLWCLWLWKTYSSLPAEPFELS